MASPIRQVQVRRYLWRLAEVLSLLALVAIVCYLFVWSLQYTLPFVIGAFFAILLLPLARQLERRGVHRTAAVITVLVGIVVLLVAISTFTVVAVAREAPMWTETISDQFNLLQNWVSQQITVGQALFGQLPPTVAAELDKTSGQAIATLQKVFTNFASALIHSVTSLPDSMFVVIIALIATYFMLANRTRMYNRFLAALPPGWGDKVTVVANDMMDAFAGTIQVQVVLMLMSAVLGVIGMWVLGIQYAVILGILFGVAGIVPLLGSAIISVPWAIGALLVGDTSLALKVIILQLAISLIRHIVEPKILADHVGLDTLSTLFALYVGMKVMGVLGLFLGPIVLIGVKSLLRIRLFMDFFPDAEIAETGSPESTTNRGNATSPESPGARETDVEGTKTTGKLDT